MITVTAFFVTCLSSKNQNSSKQFINDQKCLKKCFDFRKVFFDPTLCYVQEMTGDTYEFDTIQIGRFFHNPEFKNDLFLYAYIIGPNDDESLVFARNDHFHFYEIDLISLDETECDCFIFIGSLPNEHCINRN